VLSHAVNHRANTLQVWVPAAAARVIRVTDHVAETRPFAAKFTSHGHKYSSPHRQNSHKAKSLAKFRLLRTLFVDYLSTLQLAEKVLMVRSKKIRPLA
jgi:hypothetical protein